LYYVPFAELAAALHAPGKKRVAYALIHRHLGEKGSINDGEQTFTKKWVGGTKLVRQVNVSTGSSYVHPDVASDLFVERKVWLPPTTLEYRGEKATQARDGLAWECHIVNSETWVIEFVPYTEHDVEGVVDYAAMWDDDEYLDSSDPLSTPMTEPSGSIQFDGSHVLLPTADGKFLQLEVYQAKELFAHLRLRSAGKDRTPKLMEELVQTANHLVQPATLFGDKVGMKCPPHKIYEVAMAAWAVDMPHETLLSDSIALLRPVLLRHARALKMGPSYKDLSMRDLLSSITLFLSGARKINHVVRAKDPLDLGLQHLQEMIG